MTTLVKLVHSSNVLKSIIDTPSGIFLLQPNGNAYLISEDSTEGRIQNPIAPPIDLYSVWEAYVDADERVSYGMPRNETEENSRI